MMHRRPFVFLLTVFAFLLVASWGIVAAFGTTKGGAGTGAGGGGAKGTMSVDGTGEASAKGGGGGGEGDGSEDEIVVVTSFYPMYIAAMNLLEGVGGVGLYNLSEPQTGCLHDYQLVPSDMELLSKADVFIVNGGGMESFLGDVTAAYPDLVVIDASADIQVVEEEDEHAEDGHEHAGDEHAEDGREHAEDGHEEGGHEHTEDEHAEDGHEEDGHHHHGVNAHFWLSLPLYRRQILTMAEGLKACLADAETDGMASRDEGAEEAESDRATGTLASNAEAYLAKIDELIDGQEELRGRLEGRDVITFFDGFAYIGSDYGLNTVYSMDLDEERQISAGEVAAVVDAVNSAPEGRVAILAEEVYGSDLAETVKGETGASVIYLDPLVRGVPTGEGTEGAAGTKGVAENAGEGSTEKAEEGATENAEEGADAAQDTAYDKDAYISRMKANMKALERMATP